MNTRPWVLVMSQSMMKIFDRDIESGDLRYVKTVRNQAGRVRSRFLGRHDHGSIADGAHHHALDAGQDAHSTATDAFARRIAKQLEADRAAMEFSSLTIIAEPRFMGKIRKAMSDETLKIVARWITKDFEKAPTEEIAGCVQDAIRAERESVRLG